MKKKIVLSLMAFAVFTLSFNSCKDDADTANKGVSTGLLSDGDKAKLLDKNWYSTLTSGGVTHEFQSDNTLLLSKSLPGRWNWINNSDTMDILDNSNNRYRYVFKTIGSSTMSFTFSVDNYKTVNNYRDTE
jgi:hypothetical protein